MKKLKENKGITLIALIITIIVMLILVGVTVAVALNGGLFNKAKEAAEKTQIAVKEEKEMANSIEFELEKEDLLKKYPLEFTWYRGSEDYVQLENLNIIDLYEEILERYYDSSFETLDLTTAIKASDKLYQLYNPKIEAIGNGTHGEEFWGKLEEARIMKDGEGKWLNEENPEQQKKLMSISGGVAFGPGLNILEYYNNSLSVSKGKNKYWVISCNENCGNISCNAFHFSDLQDYLEESFPAGSFPFDKIAENAKENQFCQLKNSGEELEIRRINSSNTGDLNILSNGEDFVEAEDNIGKFVLITVVDGGQRVGLILQNVVLMNEKTYEIYYINDNGVADREIP